MGWPCPQPHPPPLPPPSLSLHPLWRPCACMCWYRRAPSMACPRAPPFLLCWRRDSWLRSGTRRGSTARPWWPFTSGNFCGFSHNVLSPLSPSLSLSLSLSLFSPFLNALSLSLSMLSLSVLNALSLSVLYALSLPLMLSLS